MTDGLQTDNALVAAVYAALRLTELTLGPSSVTGTSAGSGLSTPSEIRRDEVAQTFATMYKAVRDAQNDGFIDDDSPRPLRDR